MQLAILRISPCILVLHLSVLLPKVDGLTHLSVLLPKFTVCSGLQAMLFAALSSCETRGEPYPTAQNLGDQPLSKEQFAKLRRGTLRPSTQAAASRNDPEVMSTSSGPLHSSHVLKCDLVLTHKLSQTVFYGR